jgi:tetratricopeptide (TPR) repeat protein
MKQLLAFASSLLAEVADAQGQDRQAVALLEDSVTLFRDIGDTYGLAMALRILGTVVQTQGDVRHATALYEESLALRRALGDLHGIAECLEGLAEVAVAQQHLHQAARLLAAAEALRGELGAPLSSREQARIARHVATVRTGLGAAAFSAAWTAGQTAALAHTSTSHAACSKPP